MREQEIIEENKLIADFMDVPFIMAYIDIRGEGELTPLYDSSNFPKDYISVTKDSVVETRLLKHNLRQLKYHSSWDWLMPVIEKIESLEIPTKACTNCDKDKVYLVQFPGGINDDKIYYSRFTSVTSNSCFIANCTGNSKIEASYNTVVSFIKWYNDNIKQ